MDLEFVFAFSSLESAAFFILTPGKPGYSPLFIAQAKNMRRFTSRAPYIFKAIVQAQSINGVYK
jgi:hypothetical protein